MNSDAYLMVHQFHTVTGAAIDDRSYPVKLLRANLIAEEAKECVQALRYGGTEQIAKELADLLYVGYGSAVSLGIDLDGALAAVHFSNMTKLVDGKPVMRTDGKVLKGPNYLPPDMSLFVRELS